MRAVALILSAVALAACGDDTVPAKTGMLNLKAPASTSDDFAIKTHDGGMILAVRSDTVRMRLSDSALAAVKQEVARETNDSGASGIGAYIKRKVGAAVAKTMELEMSVPVSSIKGVAREDSSVRLTMRDDSDGLMFSSGKSKKKGSVGAFAPADADRFVAYLAPRLKP
ncbi:MAG: hypothetical protein HY275_06575 [Gemmatimonadetes bacterium]|nr:hypothetical protein [Gemmatimonadota bacterium]